MSFDQMVEFSRIKGIAFLESDMRDYMETHHDIVDIEGYALVRPLSLGSFLSLKMIDNIPENNNSIIDCLHRSIIQKGYILNEKVLRFPKVIVGK